MPKVIDHPTEIKAHGSIPKIIQEFVGRVNTSNEDVSVARMESPSGWKEPGQTPDFDEYTVMLSGTLRVETKEATVDLHAGQAFIAEKGTWVRYSSPHADGAQYIAVCIPAFSPETVHRDEE